MVILVIGGADSGKSEYAEQLLVGESGGLCGENFGGEVDGCGEAGFCRRIYIATMPATKEAKVRIKRHVERRAQMGFTTIEYFDDAPLALPHDAFVLFEDLPNYVADIMFSGYKSGEYEKKHDLVSDNGDSLGNEQNEPDNLAGEWCQFSKNRIVTAIDRIIDTCANIVFATGDLCSAGSFYEKEVTDYLKVLGHVQQHIAKRADRVIEVVAGVAVAIK